MFSMNDPKKQGSYYLQCKMEHAKDLLHQQVIESEYDIHAPQETMETNNDANSDNTNGNKL